MNEGNLGSFSTMSISFEAKPTYATAFLPVSTFREVEDCLQEAAEEKNKQTKKTLYSIEVHNFEPLGKDKARLIGAFCNVIIPSLFVIKYNSLSAIYHLIYSGGYHVPREFCIMVRRRNKFQTIAGRRRAGKAARGWKSRGGVRNPKAVHRKQRLVSVPDGNGWFNF